MTVGQSEWYLPSTQAMWIPAGFSHSLYAKYSTSYVSVFVDRSRESSFSNKSAFCKPNKLVHELILSSSEFGHDYKKDSAEFRLAEVLVDQIMNLECCLESLPMPKNKKLKHIVDNFIRQPDISHSLDLYANNIGASLRTLQRQFRKETGYDFSRWKQHYLVQRGIELLKLGQSVTRVAYDFGYQNSASFSTMFKRITGLSPKQYLSKIQ